MSRVGGSGRAGHGTVAGAGCIVRTRRRRRQRQAKPSVLILELRAFVADCFCHAFCPCRAPVPAFATAQSRSQRWGCVHDVDGCCLSRNEMVRPGGADSFITGDRIDDIPGWFGLIWVGLLESYLQRPAWYRPGIQHVLFAFRQRSKR